MKTSIIWNPGTSVCSRPGTSSVYKTRKSSYDGPQKNANKISVLFRRYAINNQNKKGGSLDSPGLFFLLRQLGFSINWDKTVLQPSQKMEFSGMILDRQCISLPREKVMTHHFRPEENVTGDKRRLVLHS